MTGFTNWVRRVLWLSPRKDLWAVQGGSKPAHANTTPADVKIRQENDRQIGWHTLIHRLSTPICGAPSFANWTNLSKVIGLTKLHCWQLIYLTRELPLQKSKLYTT